MSGSMAEVKLNNKNCVVCFNSAIKEIRVINSRAGREKRLKQLLLKYGEINVVEGVMCRTCERKLLSLHNECNNFRTQCQNTSQNFAVKRCASSTSPSTSPAARKPLALIQIQAASSSVASLSTSSPRPKSSKTSKTKYLTINPATDVTIQPFSDSAVRVLDNQSDESTTNLLRTNLTQDASNNTVAQLIAANLSSRTGDRCLTTSQCSAVVDATNTKSLMLVVGAITAASTAAFEHQVTAEIETVMDKLKARKRGTPSMLLAVGVGKSAYETLTEFSWDKCVSEFHSNFPLLCNVLVSAMLGRDKKTDARQVDGVLQRLGMIYAIIVQCRIPYLSRVQRLMSAILTDSLVDVKVGLTMDILSIF